MDATTPDLDPKALRRAWQQLCSSGTASPTIAKHLRVGIRPFLEEFERHYLGPANLGQGSKLVLGKNGEGKTHLLLCLRELALRNGHAVALIEPKTSAVGDSAFVFAQEVLRRIETSELANGDDSAARVPSLLRMAVERKRNALVAKGLDPENLLPRWADGFRDKDLHPFGLAAAIADGLLAAIEDHPERLREAAARIAFEDVKLSKKDAEVNGGRLLQSLPIVVKHLGFESLIILLDEAETAVERAGSARRRQFLKFLRFLNDQVANQADERAPAMVIIGCTDDFWPEQFSEYYALQSRLADPGRDEPRERQGLKPRALVRLNKVWVRETFRGDESDYEELGGALVELAGRLYPDLDAVVQKSNVGRFARVASSDAVKKEVKRNFIKALCQDIESQMANETQRVIEEKDARKALDAAVKAIHHDDSKKEGQ